MKATRFTRGLAVDESGEATLEFVGVTLIVLVPLVYLVLAFFQIQAGMYAAEAGVAQATRILTEHPHIGMEAAQLGVELAAKDQGIPVDNARLQLLCESDCPAAGVSGRLRVDITVPLPVIGPLLEGLIPAQIPVSAEHTIRWGEYGA